MKELEHLKRIIKLKRQALPLICREIHELEEQYCLLRMLKRCEAQISGDFNSRNSRKIDALHLLLDD